MSALLAREKTVGRKQFLKEDQAMFARAELIVEQVKELTHHLETIADRDSQG